MNKISLLLILSLLFIWSCDDDEPMEPPTFLELLAGSHTGDLEELNCSLPQSVVGTVSMTADILEISETEINVSLNNTAGEFLNFDGIIDSDTTFSIIEFEDNGTTYKGSGKLTNKLEIFLGDGCVIFGTEAAKYIFTED